MFSVINQTLSTRGAPRETRTSEHERNLEGSIRGEDVESTYFCLQEMLNHVIEEFHEVPHILNVNV